MVATGEVSDTWPGGAVSNPPWVSSSGASEASGALTLQCTSPYSHVTSDDTLDLTGSHVAVPVLAVPGGGATVAPVADITSTTSQLRQGSTSGPRMLLAGMNVWGVQDPVVGPSPLGDQQYAARTAIAATLREWGVNYVRMRLWADYWNGLDTAGKAAYIQKAIGWRDALKAAGILTCFCWWDALDGTYAGASWASNYWRAFDLMDAVTFAVGDDPYVFYEPFNEPNNVSRADWYTAMAATITHFRTNIGYQGLLVIDPTVWAHDWADTEFTNLENHDAGLTDSTLANIAFARHDYPNDYSGQTWNDGTWTAATGGSSRRHIMLETEFGPYNGPSVNNATWAGAAATFFASQMQTQTNFCGAAPFLFGNWYDANAITTGDYETTTTWGGYAKTNFLAAADGTVLPASTAQVILRVEASAGNSIETIVEIQDGAHVLVFREQVGGIPTNVTIPYDPTEHHWWRIRENGGTVRWETAPPDGGPWTIRRTTITSLTLTAVAVSLRCGYWGDAESAPGVARFGPFNILPVPSTPVFPVPPGGGVPVPVLQTIRFGNEVGAQYLLSLERCIAWLMGGGTDGKPTLRLGNSTPQEIPDDEDTPVLWNTAISDVHQMWDPDNPETITIRASGQYWVHCSFQFSGDAAGSRHLWPLINGTDLDGSADDSEVGAGVHTARYLGLLTLPEGTQLQFMTRQTSGGPVNSGLGNFNPRLDVMWAGRISGQVPAYVGNDGAELPESVATALTAINDQLTLINGRLNALEATQPTPPPDPDEVTQVVRINCGGTGFVDAGGVQWEADRGATESGVSAQGSGRAYGTERDALYFTERWGNFTYTFGGLPPGDATVNLHFAENHDATNAAGERLFDVSVNGALKLDNYDVFAEAGNAQHVPVVETIDAEVEADGTITIAFATVVNSAMCNGIEILCEGTDAPPDPDPGDPGTPPPPTGFWYSGVTRPEIQGQYTQGSVDVWSSWRQRPVNMALTYTVRTGTWDNIVGPGYALNNWTDKSLVVLVAQPFTPNSLGNAPNGNQARAILTGQHDAQWRRWGETLKARRAQGFVEPVTCLAWEFNGNWMNHSATNPTEFIGAWRRVVNAVRSVHPGALFSWTVNAGYSQNPASHDARTCWPGDSYVDFVGVDGYDHFPKAVGYSAVNTRESTVTGRMKYWEEFAAAHGKKMILQEWGLNSSTNDTANGGGDNPGYIEWMFDWFEHLWANNRLFGECYFNDVNTANVWSDLLGGKNPQSSLKYRQLWLPAQP